MSFSGETVTALCPVCEKQVPMNTINNHIDVCLLPGGQQLQNEDSEDVNQGFEPLTSAQDVATNQFKQTSSPLPASGKGKQSVLSFSKASSFPDTSPTGRLSSISEVGEPPPSKIRKVTSDKTPKSRRRTASDANTQDGTSRKKAIFSTSHSYKPSSVPPPAAVEQTSSLDLQAPLAELARPHSIDEFVGQENIIGKNTILRTILETGLVPSLIFWGPPGCGKTTLARIISKVSKQKVGSRFVHLSATMSGVNEVKQVVKVAKNEKMLLKTKTILFVDEIHRFNKLQQDAFLPHVEDGTITLLGATTENPSFQLNSALLSRCRVIVLEKLEVNEIETLLRRALVRIGAEVLIGGSQEEKDGCTSIKVEPEALTTLAQLCDGDARSALNGLHLAVQAKQAQTLQIGQLCKPTATFSSQQTNEHFELDAPKTESVEPKPPMDTPSPPSPSCEADLSQGPSSSSGSKPSLVPIVTVKDVKESLQRTHLLYDRAGEDHYNIISALHKSMRGSDANASLYWLARMLCAGEDPLYVARRIVAFACEDIGLADPNALTQAVATFQGCQFLGMPACELVLAQAVVYMSRAPKSMEVYSAYSGAKKCIMEHKGPLPSVPLHLRNASTQLTRTLGYGQGYKYYPSEDQDYLPEGIKGVNFFQTDYM